MTAGVLRFGPFELNARSGELFKDGRRLPLSPQPVRLLSLLASRAGELVTRDEIRRHLWPDGVFVDFDLGLNSCLAHVRTVLGDRARSPRYIETLPRRGYRFVAPVERPRPFPQPTIAVLPFANLAADASLEYFADGMTDALITELASVAALRVISRQTVLHLKGSCRPLPDIGRELGVDAVVEGTVLHTGATIRITAQLLAVSPERHIWAHAYECAPADVVSIHGQVARNVSAGVHAALTPFEVGRLSRASRVTRRAHEAYLKGLFHSDWSSQGMAKAMACFEEAVAADPGYAAPRAALGALYNDLGYWGYLPAADAYARTKREALAALSLDEGLAQAHVALGWASWNGDWDVECCERERRRALELGPGDVRALMLSGAFRLAVRRETDAGIAEIEEAARLDPLSPSTGFFLAWCLLFAGHAEQARVQARATLALFPGSLHAWYVLGLAEQALGSQAAAIDALERAMAIAPERLSFGYLGYAYGMAGRAADARRLLAELTARSEGTFTWHKPFMVIHIGLGEIDRALDYLEATLSVRDPILFLVPFAPLFSRLRGEPRYQAVMDRLPRFASSQGVTAARRQSSIPTS
jgi:TolB-like protein